MNTAIVLTIAAVVVVSIAAIVFSQLREKAKIELARKVTALENRFSHTKKLFYELPGQYLSPELKLILLQRMEEIAQELTQLKTRKPAANWLAETKELRAAVTAGTDQRPSIKIDSKEQSTQINELLESLFKLIEHLHASGRLNKDITARSLRQVLFLIHKTNADLHIAQAQNFIRQGESRKAIHEYHLASTELGKSKDNETAAKAIEALRAHIKELEAIASESNSTENQQQRDKQWDAFLEDDSWKKKADYDD